MIIYCAFCGKKLEVKSELMLHCNLVYCNKECSENHCKKNKEEYDKPQDDEQWQTSYQG